MSPLDQLRALAARAGGMGPEQMKKFRKENDARIDELLFQLALQAEARRICGEMVH